MSGVRGMAAERNARRWILATASAVTLLASGMWVPAQAVPTIGAAAAARMAGAGDALLDVVILVDESGSETAAKVADERQTAGTIAQTMLNPHSRVTVVGFGGVNNLVPNQNPVNVACRPTIASGAVNLSYLASCVNSLHRRGEAEGDDTDYAAALGQAMSYFTPATAYGQQSPPGAIKVILMMTDGGLDVSRDTRQYGTDWLNGAHHAVDLELNAARADRVQVWPLGFGAIAPTDQAYLNYLAANGAQTSCDNRSVSKPHATVVNDPAAAPAALNALYADAGCLGSSGSSVSISGSQTQWLQVSVPSIASDAALGVARGNPGIGVSYYRPDGTQWTDGSAISGTGTAVQVLHATSPQPGNWRIKLTAPPGLPSELVNATVFWQGAVDALMTVSPSSARPGQPINVRLSVLGAIGPVTAADLQVVVSVSGDGLPRTIEIPVTNAGQEQGTATGFGDYQGAFTAPRAQGTLTFTGTAAGYGLFATQVPATVQVGTGAAAFQGTVQFPVISSVLMGQGIHGQVLFANNTGTTRTVRLLLAASHVFATITGGAIQLPPGNSHATPFTINVARNSPPGPAWFEIKVVDAPTGAVYGAATLDVTVTSPPGLLGKYFWAIVGGLILLLLGASFGVLRWRRRRDECDVRGLYAIIRHDDEPTGSELKAPPQWADTFRFIVRDEGQPTARLDYPGPRDPAYTARRGRTGRVMVQTPAGERYDITVGGPGAALASGLQLAFRDAKRRWSQASPEDASAP